MDNVCFSHSKYIALHRHACQPMCAINKYRMNCKRCKFFARTFFLYFTDSSILFVVIPLDVMLPKMCCITMGNNILRHYVQLFIWVHIKISDIEHNTMMLWYQWIHFWIFLPVFEAKQMEMKFFQSFSQITYVLQDSRGIDKVCARCWYVPLRTRYVFVVTVVCCIK